MNEHHPFVSTIMDAPFEMGPIMVYADWLQERGDPRGELLAIWPELVNKAKKIKPVVTQTISGADRLAKTLDDRCRTARGIKFSVCRVRQSLYSILLSRFAPTTSGRRFEELIADGRSQRAITAALLRDFRLLSKSQTKMWSDGAAMAMKDAEYKASHYHLGWNDIALQSWAYSIIKNFGSQNALSIYQMIWHAGDQANTFPAKLAKMFLGKSKIMLRLDDLVRRCPAMLF